MAIQCYEPDIPIELDKLQQELVDELEAKADQIIKGIDPEARLKANFVVGNGANMKILEQEALLELQRRFVTWTIQLILNIDEHPRCLRFLGPHAHDE
jgi:hypothetical protein